MRDESRTAAYDQELRLEAYRFHRSFPKHFHTCYVIGYVEDGQGGMICRDVAYTLKKGDVVIFNPGDLHCCAESCAALDYWGLHIPRDTMLERVEEITGRRTLPHFSRNVIADKEAARCCRSLHQQVMEGASGKEASLVRLIARLLEICGQPEPAPACREAVERACAYMEEHCGERIRLDHLGGLAGLSKSALLRAFVREKGVTPYAYLEGIRVSAAKKLLERGVPPAEAALRTGFSDQSHFTRYFSRCTGLAPGAYRELFWNKEKP